MTENELTQQLFAELSKQDQRFMWIIGTLIVVVGGLYGLLQWRLSNKQIESMKEKFKEEYKEEFKKEFREDYKNEFHVKETEDNIKKLKKLNEQYKNDLSTISEEYNTKINELNKKSAQIIFDMKSNNLIAMSQTFINTDLNSSDAEFYTNIVGITKTISNIKNSSDVTNNSYLVFFANFDRFIVKILDELKANNSDDKFLSKIKKSKNNLKEICDFSQKLEYKDKTVISAKNRVENNLNELFQISENK